ncbi:phosphate ABC transporter permease subunit PstC [Halalkalicoccus jeotgali]|uniref:Phosphate transport system permease protein n=1 Tax=Halalkalicoccus jeotgali (strain DSM 18796 / CECT 7217 / JCM 14584 / KCTC 4019 / B3) TaxID=795797 RepID=D8J5J5_HALJB|nr:phosphate ABC transporter permease subunit PstC [Halalkalicoccus jeotgali]ADJ15691.1 phosphate ABC transporter, inner membrane subunit PstC [Halalkalicoccus jeotgali B3]ELY36539.1 phosphate ABC transporter inner membrane subunit PstC [Halalkalicoccus jeotgali B3]
MSTETDTLDLEDGASRSLEERVIETLLFISAVISVFVTLGIIYTLTADAIGFFRDVSPLTFLLGSEWSPAIEPNQFGVLPLVTGTLLVTVLSALIAIPVGLAAAIYLSEYASSRIRSVIKPALEVLAGIPTVVYGYFGLVYITPVLDSVGLNVGTFNVLSASIMVGVMIIPMVSSLSEDAMSAVPDELRQAGYGLGATKFEVSTGVVVPAAASGIFSAFILALSRAIGETMIVAVAMGQRSRMFSFESFPGILLESGQTMTAAMVQLGTSDVSAGTTAYSALFAIGLTLFVITFLMNLTAEWVASRYQEEYR